MKYFRQGLTKEELTAEYRRLAKQYHPDVCKDANATEIMTAINAEYDTYFVTIQKESVGIDWDDLFARYAEARKTREAVLRFMNFDKQQGSGWFTIQKIYNLFWGSTTIKYVSDGTDSWDNFHGGFALTQELTPAFGEVNRSLHRIPAKIECPTLQDMYFAMYGQAKTDITEIQATEVKTEAAYVSMFDTYKHIRTKKRGEMWIDDDTAYMKVNGLVMASSFPSYLLKDCEVLETCKGTDFGYYQFQDCSEEEFRKYHDVQYTPMYSEALGCKRLKENELWWIDDPVVAHFARIGVLDFYESGENFRMRYGTFSNIGLQAHLHELTIEDAEHIQDFLDELNNGFEDYIKRLVKRGKLRIAI